ncbi:MAG: DUF6157 family protein [Nitrospirota bacterium]
MNYVNTFIAVAPDTTAKAGTVPPSRSDKKSIAQLEYELISGEPYTLTQEEVQFSVHVQRQGISAAELKAKRAKLWSGFFSKPMACMRASPLPKSYGWGLHFDAEGKVALVAVESHEYKRRLNNPAIRQLSAMRSKRARTIHAHRSQTMPKMNVKWHEQNKMPTKPTEEQRIKWHLAHEKNCKCRPIPKGVVELIRNRGKAA